MRVGLSILGFFMLVPGCFNPEDTPSTTLSGGTDDTGTASTGTPNPTTGVSTSSGSTAAVDESGDPATTVTSSAATSDPGSTTEVGDRPPTVVLEVEGSATPPDLIASGNVRLGASAMDDGAIDRVEFFDGDTLIATDDTEPYGTQVLTTSVNNGTHVFSARAFDDGGAQGDSDPVTLEVNIAGGGLVASDSGLWQTGGIAFNPGGGATTDQDGNIIVAAPISTTGFAVTGAAVASFTPDLGDINWQVTQPESLVDGQNQYLPMGGPHVSNDGSAVLIGGNAMGDDGILDPNASIFRFAADGSGPLPFVEVPSNPDVQIVPTGGITQDADGNVFLAGPDDNITKFGPDGVLIWESPTGLGWTLGELGLYRLRADPEGDVIADIVACPTDCTVSTRKVRGTDGVEQWTEELTIANEAGFLFSAGVSAPGPDGNVAFAYGPPGVDGGGVMLGVRDSDGAGLQNNEVMPGPQLYTIMDAAYDPQGGIVVAGVRDDAGTREAWVARVQEDGSLAWETALSFGADDAVLGIDIDNAGKVNVVGFSDVEEIFVVFLGDLWVAQLDL